MAGRDGAERLLGLADDVVAAPQYAIAQIAGTRCIHGEVAGIFHRTFADLFQVKRARPLQDHLSDLTIAFADMGLQPGRNARGPQRREGSGRHRQRDGEEAQNSDTQRNRSQPHRIISLSSRYFLR